MATSTLTPNDNDAQEDRLNPVQGHYDRAFNNIASNHDKTADGAQEDANAERARLRGREGVAGLSPTAAASSTTQKEHEGSWTTNMAGAAANLAGVKVPFLTRKRKGVLGAVIGFVSVVGALVGLVVPNYAIVNLKEVATNKLVSHELAAYEERTGSVMNAKLIPRAAPDTSAGCAVKVRCRFKGTSKRGIEKLRNAGFSIESEPIKGHPLGYERIKTISYTDDAGKKIDMNASEYRKALRTNPKVVNMLHQAYKPRFALFADNLARGLTNKLRIFRGNQLEGVTDKKSFVGKFREALKGHLSDANGHRLTEGKSATEDPNADKTTNADRAKQLSGVTDEITSEADKLSKSFTAGDVIGSLPDADSPSVENIAKEAAKGSLKDGIKGLLGPGAIANSMCGVYSMIAAVGFGAKIIAATQLIRFYYVFSNTADAIKAGDATTEQVSQLGNMLSSKDDNGRTFADSFGYQWLAYGTIGNKDEPMKYRLGGGVAGSLTNLKSEIDKFGGGKACKVITNPFVQGVAFLGYAIGSFFTGGGLTASSVALGFAVSTAISVAKAIVTPMLIRLVAGVLVTGNENGKDTGDAFAAGGGAFHAFSAKNRALKPMTKTEALAYDREAAPVLAMSTAADRIDANPWDISNPITPAGGIFARFAPYAVSPFSDSSVKGVASMLNPVKTFGSLFASLNPQAKALDSAEQYDLCPDPDYQDLHLAADPFCNLVHGADLNKLGDPKFDPDKVIDYMLKNNFIDNDGKPQNDYKQYITDCLENDKPLSADGDAEYSLPKYCFDDRDSEKQTYWRTYFMDTTINNGIQEQMDGKHLDADMGIGGNQPTAGSAPANGSQPGGAAAPQGSPQQLAQQIVASGKVTGYADTYGQIKNYAAGNFSCNVDTRVLQTVLYGAQRGHTMFITSLNRLCTGDSNAGGAGGAHATDNHSRDGGGHAVDFDNVDGGDSTGGLAKDVNFLRDLLPAFPPNTEIGQRDCRSGANVLVAPGMNQVRDVCNHIHLGFPG